MKHHPFSDEKDGFRTTNNLGQAQTKKMGATTVTEKMGQTRNTQNSKAGTNTRAKDKSNYDNEKYMAHSDNDDLKEHNISTGKVNENRLKEHASTLSKKEDPSEIHDNNNQNTKWENMISNRDDNESDTNNDDLKGNNKQKLNQDPNPSDDEEMDGEG